MPYDKQTKEKCGSGFGHIWEIVVIFLLSKVRRGRSQEWTLAPTLNGKHSSFPSSPPSDQNPGLKSSSCSTYSHSIASQRFRTHSLLMDAQISQHLSTEGKGSLPSPAIIFPLLSWHWQPISFILRVNCLEEEGSVETAVTKGLISLYLKVSPRHLGLWCYEHQKKEPRMAFKGLLSCQDKHDVRDIRR